MEYKTMKIIIEDFSNLGKEGISQKEKEFVKKNYKGFKKQVQRIW